MKKTTRQLLFSQGQLPLAQMLTRVGRLKLLVTGDSIPAGFGSSSTNEAIRATSWPTLLAAKLTAAGIKSQAHNFFGTANRASDANYDPRLVRGAGWAEDAFSVASFGGLTWRNATDTSALAFTPGATTDSADIYTVGNGANTSSMTVNVDGGATITTISHAQTVTLIKTTVTFSRGTHTLNIARSTGTCRVIGASMYDSLNPAVEIWNGGWSGATSTNGAAYTNAFDYRKTIEFMAPHILISGFGSNDINPANSISAATFKTNKTNIHASAKLTARVIEMVFPPASSTLNSVANQLTYVVACREVAAANGAPIIDLLNLFGSYTAANAAGYYYDTVHPGLTGGPMIAQAAYNEVVRIGP